jgi:hypothetical protein
MSIIKLKNSKYLKIVLSILSILIVISVFYIISLSTHTNTPITTEGLKNDNPSYTKRNYEKEFECPLAVPTSASNACALEKFTRASAIREWKQRKLENLKEIDTGNLLDPVGDSLKIKKWRENFDKTRDLKCEATVIFKYGSGSSGEFSACGLKEEIDALKTLDFNYYEVLQDPPYTNKGIVIPNYEPTEVDIQKIIKTIIYSKAYENL